jgi:hypothetical protein
MICLRNFLRPDYAVKQDCEFFRSLWSKYIVLVGRREIGHNISLDAKIAILLVA